MVKRVSLSGSDRLGCLICKVDIIVLPVSQGSVVNEINTQIAL